MRVLLAACLLAAAACGKPPEPAAGALEKALARGFCDHLIPAEWPASLPIPTGGEAEFKLFFYPKASTTAEPFWIGAPLGEAVFKLDGGAACSRAKGEPRAISNRRFSEEIEGLEAAEFRRRRSRLLALSEAAGRDFAAGKAPGPEVREYTRLFQELAEPGLGPYYKALSPAFWAWVAKAGA